MAEPDAIKVSDFSASTIFIGSAVVLAIMLLCCFGLIRCSEPEPGAQHAAEQRERAKALEWKTLPHPELAYAIAQQFVDKQLLAPSSAKYPTQRQGRLDHVTQVGDIDAQRYRIISWVDAQNAFGVPIRQHFTAEVFRVTEDEWKLLTLEIE